MVNSEINSKIITIIISGTISQKVFENQKIGVLGGKVSQIFI
jgi:hypothetical protein